MILTNEGEVILKIFNILGKGDNVVRLLSSRLYADSNWPHLKKEKTEKTKETLSFLFLVNIPYQLILEMNELLFASTKEGLYQKVKLMKKMYYCRYSLCKSTHPRFWQRSLTGLRPLSLKERTFSALAGGLGVS